MKIAFLDDNKLDYTPETPFVKPLGGTESTAAYLTAALAARGHEVSLVNRTSEPGTYLGVDVPGRNGATLRNLSRFDAVVVMTSPIAKSLRESGLTVPLINWQHKAAHANQLGALGDAEEQQAWSSIVFVSEQQRSAFVDRFGTNGVVLRNAASPAALQSPFIEESFLERHEDPTLIYASAPGRGLDMLLAAFALARESLPNLRLHVCSDQRPYQTAMGSDSHAAVYALARAVPGVEFIGSVSQTQLGVAMSRADILAYPTAFMETSCIVAIEAAAAGCLYVGNDLGPLRETMAGFGQFTPKVNSRSQTSLDVGLKLVEVVEAARADPAAYKARRAEQSRWFRETHTWERRAAEWEAYLADLLGKAV